MTNIQGNQLDSARAHLARLQQALATAERIAREKELASAKATSRTQAVEARWRAFVETIPDALIISNQNGVVEFANGATGALLGYQPHQLVGQPSSTLVPHATDQLLGRGKIEPREVETVLRHASGGTRELAVRVQEFSALGRRHLCLRIRDVSGIKYLLNELKQARAVRASSERSQERFIATMSHEIRTPLHGLMATLDMLRSEPLSAEGATGYRLHERQRKRCWTSPMTSWICPEAKPMPFLWSASTSISIKL